MKTISYLFKLWQFNRKLKRLEKRIDADYNPVLSREIDVLIDRIEKLKLRR